MFIRVTREGRRGLEMEEEVRVSSRRRQLSSKGRKFLWLALQAPGLGDFCWGGSLRTSGDPGILLGTESPEK